MPIDGDIKHYYGCYLDYKEDAYTVEYTGSTPAAYVQFLSRILPGN